MSIKYIRNKEFLEVIFTGERSFAAISHLIDIVYKQCQRNNLRRVLIDVSAAKGKWEDFDRFLAGERVSQVFGYHYKILAIDKEENINKFAENTAVNRGASFLVTPDKEKGLKWLLEKS
jgi:hypothetical protein